LVEFSADGIINNSLSWGGYAVLITLYLIGFAAIVFVPIYLLYARLYYLASPIIIITFVTSYGLVSLFMLLKVITNIFGIEVLIYYNNQISYGLGAKLILALNLLISMGFALAGKNLKKILIYLFFNQLIFTILTFFIFQLAIYPIIVTIFSFVLSQVLIFFCVGNINLYLLNSKEKSLKEIFWKLKITISFLIFALLNMVGVIPGVGFAAKYYLIKEIIESQSFFAGSIVVINITLNIVCITQILRPMLTRRSKVVERKNYEISKEVDLDPGLFLAILFISLIIIMLLPLSFQFSSLITDFV